MNKLKLKTQRCLQMKNSHKFSCRRDETGQQFAASHVNWNNCMCCSCVFYLHTFLWNLVNTVYCWCNACNNRLGFVCASGSSLTGHIMMIKIISGSGIKKGIEGRTTACPMTYTTSLPLQLERTPLRRIHYSILWKN
jgi:uncharacterized membrane protein